jgi:hypothetical protein
MTASLTCLGRNGFNSLTYPLPISNGDRPLLSTFQPGAHNRALLSHSKLNNLCS